MAVAALVAGMQAHLGVAAVQQECISALVHITAVSSAGADAVVAAGGVAAVVAGMRAHVEVAKVQELGITALANIADDNPGGSGAVAVAGGVAVEAVATSFLSAAFSFWRFASCDERKSGARSDR